MLKEVEAMRQYEEDVENLNEIAHNRPRAHLVLGRKKKFIFLLCIIDIVRFFRRLEII